MSDSFIEEKLKNIKISRRDFMIKGSKAVIGGGIALSVGKYLNRDGDTEHITENSWRSIEGSDGGMYIPIYESHKLPYKAESFEGMKDVDVAFYEVTRPSSDMLDKTGSELVGTAEEWFSRDTWIPTDQVKHWGEKGTFIGFEGLSYNSTSLVLKHSIGQLIEGFGGVLLLAKTLGQESKAINYKDKEILSGEIKNTLMQIGGAWGSSSLVNLVTGTFIANGVIEGSEGLKGVSQRIQRVSQLISQIHPEDELVFLRNLLMARRLQSIKETFPQRFRDADRENNSPTTIAFNVGAMHSGIEDWLLAGPDLTKLALELYPANWKELVNINGSPEAMATMPLVLNNGMMGAKVVNLKDEWFEDFLNRKTK